MARAVTALETVAKRYLHPGSAEFLYALGPGRAYGVEGGIWNVTYPAIKSCGILEAARKKEEQAQRVIALLTDIGNDIMYGVPTDTILATLSEILDRLHALNAEISVTTIPVDLERDVGEKMFKIIRGIYFMKSRVTFPEAVSAVDRINRFATGLESDKVRVIQGLEEFAGLDKIHYDLLKFPQVWSRVAGEMFRLPGEETRHWVTWKLMRQSLQANGMRILFSDMLGIRKKDPGFF